LWLPAGVVVAGGGVDGNWASVVVVGAWVVVSGALVVVSGALVVVSGDNE
jgi:hypothetical protein